MIEVAARHGGNKCPHNGSKNDSFSPRRPMGYPHEGPRVDAVGVWALMAPKGARVCVAHSRIIHFSPLSASIHLRVVVATYAVQNRPASGAFQDGCGYLGSEGTSLDVRMRLR